MDYDKIYWTNKCKFNFQDVNQAVMLIDAMPADTDTKPITSPPATDK